MGELSRLEAAGGHWRRANLYALSAQSSARLYALSAQRSSASRESCPE